MAQRQQNTQKLTAVEFNKMIDMDRFANLGQTSARAVAEMNTAVIRGWFDLNSEMLDFARHRFQEDVDTGQKLTSCRNMSQMIDVVDEFYRKAFSEYADEFGKILKLSSEVAAKTLETAEAESKHIADQSNGGRAN